MKWTRIVAIAASLMCCTSYADAKPDKPTATVHKTDHDTPAVQQDTNVAFLYVARLDSSGELVGLQHIDLPAECEQTASAILRAAIQKHQTVHEFDHYTVECFGDAVVKDGLSIRDKLPMRDSNVIGKLIAGQHVVVQKLYILSAAATVPHAVWAAVSRDSVKAAFYPRVDHHSSWRQRAFYQRHNV